VSLLTVANLDVRLAGRSILSDVSVSVPEGGLVAILGRNGVGKTTLLRTVSGLYRPSAGRIAIGGMEIGGLAPHRVVQAGIAQAPEGRQLFGEMDVIENLRAGALQLSRADFERRVDYVSGLFPIVFDIGYAGSMLYFVAAGALVGALWSGWRRQARAGVLFFPMAMMFLVELLRFDYFASSRFFPVAVALALIWATSRPVPPQVPRPAPSPW